MKSIETKYIGPTDTKSGRVVAKAHGVKPLTISYWIDDDAHLAAALALARREGWTGQLMRGGRADGRGDVFVFAQSTTYTI